MPHRQRHRGRHPDDARLFEQERLPVLRKATHELSWLLSHDYGADAALRLVGDHHQLALRQRRAIARAACSDAALARRRAHEVPIEAIGGGRLSIDGYNLLIMVESAISGGFLVAGRDGCLRDLASIHGAYRRVEETMAALTHIGESLEVWAPSRVIWYFDAPVSNSGRLRQRVLELAGRNAWPWEAELRGSLDHQLAKSGDVIATADSWILDRAARWANMGRAIVERLPVPASVVDLQQSHP